MTTENVCPFCGAPLEANTGSQCPACGSALPNRNASSAPTIISKKPVFENSAEAMDEVKRLVNEGDTAAATEVASAEFGLNQEAARSTVDQVEIDMQHSGYDTPPAASAPASTSSKVEVIDAPGYTEPKKSSNRNWIIGGSVAAVIFLCVCCCLPILVMIVMNVRRH